MAFNAVKFADLSKKQLFSSLKRFGEKQKELLSMTKDEGAQHLSAHLLQHGYVTVAKGVTLQGVEHCHVTMANVF